MEFLDHDYSVHITPGGGDDSLFVRFFIDAVEDTTASKAAGRPIFKDVDWIEIRAPGPRGEGVIRPCRPGDKERFPKHYAAFKARVGKDGEEIVGTPLSTWAWAGMTRARVEELKYFNVRSVEQLANMPDNLGQNIMSFQQMKQAAKTYLETVRLSAPIARLQVQLEMALGKLAEQGLEIARLRAREHGLPEPAASDVLVPMREQIAQELNKVKAETAEVIPMGSKKRKAPPPKRRPGY